MMELKHVAIYPIIFVLGACSFGLVYVVLGFLPFDFTIINAISAGLAATIAAWLVGQPYRRALADDRRKALYGWLLLGVLLAHLLIGFLIMLSLLLIGNRIHLSEIIWSALVFSLFSVPFGFVQNMLFGAMLTEFLRRRQQKGASKCV